MDLTKITTAFALLDDETRRELLSWPHGLEWFDGKNWSRHDTPQDSDNACPFVYRAIPAPSECWISKTDPSEIIYREPVYDRMNWRHFREVKEGVAP